MNRLQSFFLPLTRNSLTGLSVFTAVLALSVQVQLNILESPTSYGVRLSGADFLLPFAGVTILVSLLMRRSRWPDFKVRGMYVWLLALSLIMTAALCNGYFYDGSISRWALFNKYAGWCVLMAYAGLGGWLVTNRKDVFLLFARYFSLAFVVMLVGLLSVFLFVDLVVDAPRVPMFEGLMLNRNAYAFLALSALALMTVWGCAEHALIAPRLVSILWFFAPSLAYMNASRAGMAVGVFLFLVFLVWKRGPFLKRAAIWFLLGALLLAAGLATADKPFFRQHQFSRTMALYQAKSQDEGADVLRLGLSEAVRMRVMDDALELWRGHKLIGVGLGTFLKYSEDKYKDDPDVIIDIIDCSLLWLLTETGLIGLGVFLAFYLLILFHFWRRSSQVQGAERVFLQSLLMLLITFAMMSMLHELLYARHLWLLIGMGACLPSDKNQAS